jgi:hypothetical protein
VKTEMGRRGDQTEDRRAEAKDGKRRPET